VVTRTPQYKSSVIVGNKKVFPQVIVKGSPSFNCGFVWCELEGV